MIRYTDNSALKSFRKSLKVLLLGTALVMAGFLGSLILTAETASSPQGKQVDSDSKVIPDAGSIHSTFTAVASAVRPAVVFIKTQRNSTASTRDRSERFGPFDFFRDVVPDDERPRRIPGGGSGFIIDKQGRILTNHHVIRDAEKITVVLGDEPYDQELDAEVVGYDENTDIAVIKIDVDRDLPTVALGDSDEMLEGDWVMAIGTPFGQLQGTVTVGVVSAKGRNDLQIMGGEAVYQNYIQTDASINFGNSGGPLVNLRGEAIGINTAINPSGQGIGFAIPINMVKSISAQLIEKGRVQYGFMGIQLQELTPDLSAGLGLDIERGILVTQVLPDTPAEKAGLQRNDVIVQYRGEQVWDRSRFQLMVGNTAVGTRVPIKIVREGKEKEVTIVLTERPGREALASVQQIEEPEGWLGLQVDDLNSSEVKQRFRVEADESGVVVLGVRQDSPAGDAGIREGDIITEVYSRKVDNLKDYVEISQKLKDRKEPIAFLVKRRGTSTYVPVIPERN